MHTSLAYGKKIQILRSGLMNMQMWILEKKLFCIHHNVLPDNGLNFGRNWLPGHSGMQSLHETHRIFCCYCTGKVPMCDFMHTEAETGPAFFTQLQEDLPVAVSIHSLSSFLPRLLVSRLDTRPEPREAVGVTCAGTSGLCCWPQEGKENYKRQNLPPFFTFLISLPS